MTDCQCKPIVTSLAEPNLEGTTSQQLSFGLVKCVVRSANSKPKSLRRQMFDKYVPRMPARRMSTLGKTNSDLVSFLIKKRTATASTGHVAGSSEVNSFFRYARSPLWSLLDFAMNTVSASFVQLKSCHLSCLTRSQRARRHRRSTA
jgi:hypothetical protein